MTERRHTSGTVPSFEESLTPMLLADGRRRYVGVNQAMCLLLRTDRDSVLRMTVDDLTPPEMRGDVDRMWDAFIRDGIQSGTYELLMPDGPRMRIDYSATADIEPGQHLSIFVLPAAEPNVLPQYSGPRQLSAREREVLSLVAMGEGGARIAELLGISKATVEAHVRNCLSKLEAKNRAHAIALCLGRGEIAMDFGPLSPP